MAQPIQIQQQSAFPAEIATLAATHQVGLPVAQHKSRFVGPMLFALVMGVLGFSMMLPLLGGFNVNTIILFLFGLAFVFYAFTRIRLVLSNRRSQVYVCTDGLLRVKAGSAEAIRWDQIRELSKSFMYYGQAQLGIGLKLPPALKEYRLRRNDGTELAIAKAFSKFRQLGTTIEGEVTRRMLPSAIAAYSAGQIVQFGPISVSMQGVHFPNKQEPLTWEEVHKVYTGNGMVYVSSKKKGALLYSTDTFLVPVVPNFCVLVELVKQIKSASSMSSSVQGAR